MERITATRCELVIAAWTAELRYLDRIGREALYETGERTMKVICSLIDVTRVCAPTSLPSGFEGRR